MAVTLRAACRTSSLRPVRESARRVTKTMTPVFFDFLPFPLLAEAPIHMQNHILPRSSRRRGFPVHAGRRKDDFTTEGVVHET